MRLIGFEVALTLWKLFYFGCCKLFYFGCLILAVIYTKETFNVFYAIFCLWYFKCLQQLAKIWIFCKSNLFYSVAIFFLKLFNLFNLYIPSLSFFAYFMSNIVLKMAILQSNIVLFCEESSLVCHAKWIFEKQAKQACKAIIWVGLIPDSSPQQDFS